MENCTRPADKIRARSDDEKARVREVIVAAGRELFSREGPDQVSLRRVAAAAGYAPAAIYRYFKSQEDLFLHIRERDVEDAVATLCDLVTRRRDPKRRVLALYIGTADYWLEHREAFLVLFPPARATRAPPEEEHPFARHPSVRRLLGLYYDSVDEWFDTLPRRPMAHRTAAQTLLAAVHGSLVFPLMTPNLAWPDHRQMIRRLVTDMVDHWEAAGRG